MMKPVALYVRVSKRNGQDVRSQLPDLERWAAARAQGKVWGGGKPGRRVRLSEEKEKAIRRLYADGKAIAEIARVVGLSRPTIYKALD